MKEKLEKIDNARGLLLLPMTDVFNISEVKETQKATKRDFILTK